ncbi:MAG: hypothetical protein K2Q14_00970, partial [Gammaproteobacteria bacterium]|nr:hypothetical protein [Gammaproteobacteria bacterium]
QLTENPRLQEGLIRDTTRRWTIVYPREPKDFTPQEKKRVLLFQKVKVNKLGKPLLNIFHLLMIKHLHI